MPENEKKHALWMPEGSVRAIGFFALIGAIVYNISGTEQALTILSTLAGTALGFYYGQKIKTAAGGQ